MFSAQQTKVRDLVAQNMRWAAAYATDLVNEMTTADIEEIEFGCEDATGSSAIEEDNREIIGGVIDRLKNRRLQKQQEESPEEPQAIEAAQPGE